MYLLGFYPYSLNTHSNAALPHHYVKPSFTGVVGEQSLFLSLVKISQRLHFLINNAISHLKIHGLIQELPSRYGSC